MKKILFASFEALPFIKTGGLADVVYSLPKAIDGNKYEVKIVLPLLKKIKDKYIKELKPIGHIFVNSNHINEEANILSYVNEGIEYYFIENDTFFYRDSVYGYDDDAARFSFYNLAIIEMMFNLNYFPDIIHAHDYHLGVIAALCKLRFSFNEKIAKIKHIFTIHNLAYQGIYDKKILFDFLSFDPYFYDNGLLRFNDACNFMKIALVCSDKITTVSKTYRNEILSDQYGEGLNSILEYRKDDLVGIVNGIDTSLFDPSKDYCLYANYNRRNFVTNKALCKKSLQYELGLKEDPNCLLIGMVSRLTFQKGVNLFLDELKYILNMNIQVAILGTGESKYEYALKTMENNNRGKCVYYSGYNETLAHKMYAGLDLILMPSLFEPCGISQLIAMRYGTLPLVRETGGLNDTVIPYNEFTSEGDGFSFKNYSSYEFKKVLDLAYNLFHNNKKEWKKLIRNAMAKDVSFKSSAKEYEELYASL